MAKSVEIKHRPIFYKSRTRKVKSKDGCRDETELFINSKGIEVKYNGEINSHAKKTYEVKSPNTTNIKKSK